MKEKRTKKESNKEEAKKEAHPGMADVRFSGEAKPREDLKIDWTSFIRFYNETLHKEGSTIEPLRERPEGEAIHLTVK